jgi:C4-dicarboxylate transporter DctQ subunit
MLGFFDIGPWLLRFVSKERRGLMVQPRLKKSSLRRLIRNTNGVMGLIGGLGAIALVLLTTMEVVRRYFLNRPTEWVLEISEYLIILVAFVGMAYAMQVGAHVMVDIIYRRYPGLGKRTADLIVGVLSLTFWAVLTWTALQQSLVYLERNTRSETLLAVPQFYPMMLVVLGSLFCCFQALLMIYDAVASLRSKDL